MGEQDVPLEIEQEAGITIISVLSQRIPVDMSDSFEQQIVQTVGQVESPMLLIDFAGVDFISSSILGKLIKLNGRVVTDRQGQLKLCSLAKGIAEVFRITGLEKLFSIHGSRDEAIRAFE